MPTSKVRPTPVRYAVLRESGDGAGHTEYLVWLTPAAGPKDERYLLRLVQPSAAAPPPYEKGHKVELDSRLLTREEP